MSRSGPGPVEPLSWRGLPQNAREALERKLEGLYGRERDEDAFNALAVDKQQALLLLLRRFAELRLWDAVRRVENVYGEGGVGMNFSAWPMLKSRLENRPDFTSWFARHKDTAGGFLERYRKRGMLHLLFVDNGARQSGV